MAKNLAFIVLAHQDLHRVTQLVRHFATQGCPVSLHVDKNSPAAEFDRMVLDLHGLDNVVFAKRVACDWGSFSITQATKNAAEALFEKFEPTGHVFLCSGSCLPIRPIRQLRNFLERHSGIDFIESVSVKNSYWVKGGLSEERFSLYFPFSWRKQRKRFDNFVRLQRYLKIERKPPDGLNLMLGLQWWCLTADTLREILNDPKLAQYDRFFKKCWIPDESYFQTLVRRHSRKIYSQCLTFSRFDSQGKPFLLYDDHHGLLDSSDCFIARKIWPGADRLYEVFLDPKRKAIPLKEAAPQIVDAQFDEANLNRTKGRQGLFSQGRFPNEAAQNSQLSSADYTVFVGFNDVFEEFPEWVEKNIPSICHGNLFSRTIVDYSDNESFSCAGLLPNIKIRDRNPKNFLSNIIWSNRDKHQCFLFGLRDRKEIIPHILKDPNAHLVMIKEAWLLKLLKANPVRTSKFSTAERLQRFERVFLAQARSDKTRASLTIFDLEDVLKSPAPLIKEIFLATRTLPRTILPKSPDLKPLGGLSNLVKTLRLHGLRIDSGAGVKQVKNQKPSPNRAKPYLVK